MASSSSSCAPASRQWCDSSGSEPNGQPTHDNHAATAGRGSGSRRGSVEDIARRAASSVTSKATRLKSFFGGRGSDDRRVDAGPSRGVLPEPFPDLSPGVKTKTGTFGALEDSMSAAASLDFTAPGSTDIATISRSRLEEDTKSGLAERAKARAAEQQARDMQASYLMELQELRRKLLKWPDGISDDDVDGMFICDPMNYVDETIRQLVEVCIRAKVDELIRQARKEQGVLGAFVKRRLEKEQEAANAQTWEFQAEIGNLKKTLQKEVQRSQEALSKSKEQMRITEEKLAAATTELEVTQSALLREREKQIAGGATDSTRSPLKVSSKQEQSRKRMRKPTYGSPGQPGEVPKWQKEIFKFWGRYEQLQNMVVACRDLSEGEASVDTDALVKVKDIIVACAESRSKVAAYLISKTSLLQGQDAEKKLLGDYIVALTSAYRDVTALSSRLVGALLEIQDDVYCRSEERQDTSSLELLLDGISEAGRGGVLDLFKGHQQTFVLLQSGVEAMAAAEGHEEQLPLKLTAADRERIRLKPMKFGKGRLSSALDSFSQCGSQSSLGSTFFRHADESPASFSGNPSEEGSGTEKAGMRGSTPSGRSTAADSTIQNRWTGDSVRDTHDSQGNGIEESRSSFNFNGLQQQDVASAIAHQLADDFSMELRELGKIKMKGGKNRAEHSDSTSTALPMSGHASASVSQSHSSGTPLPFEDRGPKRKVFQSASSSSNAAPSAPLRGQTSVLGTAGGCKGSEGPSSPGMTEKKRGSGGGGINFRELAGCAGEASFDTFDR
eukprot:TRINITY_DN24374_c0_g1_i1.p1 TRINITY_DN24374_c0_g1~~TRINITY_DN24374_c0_g1_i1.p1  ORF type:complete len:785 (-),score=149.42 TRINITY_DN24374_c0_g1_i1:387-2741(-)